MQAYLRSVEISGPFNPRAGRDTESRRRVFVCRPEDASQEEACARVIFGQLARRAYRRTVSTADLDVLLGFYKMGRAGGTFDSGIELALERVLVSPEFLFRIERDPTAAPTWLRALRVTGRTGSATSSWRRGCRSSCGAAFPTTSCSTLRDRAASCATRRVLEQQVRRMLADPRSQALVDELRRPVAVSAQPAAASSPIQYVFPDFDENLRQALPARDRAVLRQHRARGPQRARAADRRLHVRQRAAGAALRHSQRLRQPLPARHAARRPSAAGCSARAAS